MSRTPISEVPKHREAAPAAFAGRFSVHQVVLRRRFTVVRRALDLATGEAVVLELFPATLIETRVQHLTIHDLIPPVQKFDHPGIVEVREIVTDGTEAALVTPWIEGESLEAARLARPDQCFDVDEITLWMRALVEIMEFAHAQGGVHGALDPTAIWLRRGGLCVAGFGVNAWLRLALRDAAAKRERDGFSPWSSPAVLSGRTAGPLDDVFSFGALAYELLTGTPPVPGGWGRKKLPPDPMEKRRRKLADSRQPISRGWERLVQNCLEVHEHSRLRSFRDVRVRLGTVAPASSFVLAPDLVFQRAPALPVVETESARGSKREIPTPAAEPPADEVAMVRDEPPAPVPPPPEAVASPIMVTAEPVAPAPTVPPTAMPEPVVVGIGSPWHAVEPAAGSTEVPAEAKQVTVRVAPSRAPDWPPPSKLRRQSSPVAASAFPPVPVTTGVEHLHRPAHRAWTTGLLRAMLVITFFAVTGVGGLFVWRLVESQRLFATLLEEVREQPSDATAAERAQFEERLTVARPQLSLQQWHDVRASWQEKQLRNRAARDEVPRR